MMHSIVIITRRAIISTAAALLFFALVLSAPLLFTPLFFLPTSAVAQVVTPPTSDPTNTSGSGLIRLSEWQTYSALSNVRSAASDARGNVWAATSGGVFAYNFATKQVQEFRNIDALLGLDISVVRVAPNGDVYAGGVNGILNVYNGQRWKPVTDIFAASVQRKRITDIAFRDSLVFVGGEFGLVVFDAKSGVFTETVTRVGTLPANTPVSKLLIAGGRLWVATEAGLASAAADLRSFVNPSLWTNHTLQSIANALPIKGLAETTTGVLVGAGSGVWLWRQSSPSTQLSVVQAVLPGTVKDVSSIASDVFVGLDVQGEPRVVRFPLATPATQSTVTTFSNSVVLNSLAVVDSATVKTLAIATSDGLGLWAAGTFSMLSINSPAVNRFRDVTVDKRGAVWAANGSGNGNANVNNNGSAAGVYRLKDNKWTNFNQRTFLSVTTNTYYTVYAAPDSTVWASSWGAGLASFVTRDTGFVIKRFDTSNSPLSGLGGAFVVPGAVRTDERTGILWITNFTGDSVYALDKQGRFYGFSRPASLRSCEFAIRNLLTIDLGGIKWIGNATSSLLWAFSDGGTLTNTADDQWKCVQDVVSANVNVLVSDRIGEVWVGTKQGLYRIANPFDIFVVGRNLVSAQVKDQQLGRLSVNAIVVDAQNNKWLATNSGVWVISPDGGEVLAQFSAENSPLVSNNVLSMAFDDNTGRAYFGTDNGLSSAQTLSVRPNANFSQLRCYPQPFVPADDIELMIEGLAENAQVKVTTLDGALIRTLRPNNSRVVIWDGRDERTNELVPSGVYIVSAFSPTSGGLLGAVKAVVLQQR